MTRRTLPVAAGAGAALLALPASAMADSLDAANNGVLGESVTLNTLGIIAAVFVLLMLAGLLCLEAGMSRMKNVGTLVPKALISMAVAGIIYYAVGFAFAFGNGDIIGSTGWFLQGYGDPQQAFGIMGLSDATIESKWLFQFAFCAVSLAIVWGTTLERIKFAAYVIYARRVRGVHLSDRLALGVRRRLAPEQRRHAGLRGLDGSAPDRRDRCLRRAAAARRPARQVRPGRQAARDPRPLDAARRPRRAHPVVRLVRLQRRARRWARSDGRFAEVAMVTHPRRRAAACSARIVATALLQRTIDIGMVGNGMIAGLVAITAPSGYVEIWAAPIIGFVAGVIVVVGVHRDRQAARRPGRRAVGARPGGHLGHARRAACSPRRGWPSTTRLATRGGLFYSGRSTQLGVQALGVVVAFTFVFACRSLTFWLIKATYRPARDRRGGVAGLDIVEHGMYGYPEQFISDAELYGPAAPPSIKLNGSAGAGRVREAARA